MNEATKATIGHEAEAIRQYAAICDEPDRRWKVARDLLPGVWYDFYDPATGKYGQCVFGVATGRWHQEPRGERPVILEYQGRRGG